MTLQESIEFDQFVRCYCVGQQEVMIMAYDPRKPYLSGEQYVHNPNYLAPALSERVTKDVRTLCTALGYDINTVEFAIKDDVPYAIDFMNPAPDAELASVGEFYHNWITNAVIDLVFKRLGETLSASVIDGIRCSVRSRCRFMPFPRQSALSSAAAKKAPKTES